MRRFFTNLFIVGFLALQIFLSLQCYGSDAKFFGWQMFSHALVYRIRFYGVDSAGLRKPLPKDEYEHWFKGSFRFQPLPKDRFEVFSRGREFLLKESARIPAFLCRRLGARGYQRIEVWVEDRDIFEKEMSRQSFQSSCLS